MLASLTTQNRSLFPSDERNRRWRRRRGRHNDRHRGGDRVLERGRARRPQEAAGGDARAGGARGRHEDEAVEHQQNWVGSIKDNSILIHFLIAKAECSIAGEAAKIVLTLFGVTLSESYSLNDVTKFL